MRTDDRPTDRPRILENFERPYLANGSSDPLTFGSRVGFLRLTDRMDLLPVGPNPRWHLKISNGHISGTGRLIDFVFDPGPGQANEEDCLTKPGKILLLLLFCAVFIYWMHHEGRLNAHGRTVTTVHPKTVYNLNVSNIFTLVNLLIHLNAKSCTFN